MFYTVKMQGLQVASITRHHFVHHKVRYRFYPAATNVTLMSEKTNMLICPSGHGIITSNEDKVADLPPWTTDCKQMIQDGESLYLT